jgi:dolichyl-phosphate beta-glucosyltransferase
MLGDCLAFIAECKKGKPSGQTFEGFEIIVVDDHSTDLTHHVAESRLRNCGVPFRILKMNPNRGKGFAVRNGFFAANGDYVLMVDGDNATTFGDVAKLWEAMAAHKGAVSIAIGSRAHLEKKSIASRTLARTILMKLFHAVVAVTYFIGTGGSLCRLKDTQCGFKLFHRKDCEVLFLNNRLERWAFDVELLIVAERLKIGVVEVPVQWEEIPGSKVRVMGMVQMGLECLLMCFAFPSGTWKIKNKSPR